MSRSGNRRPTLWVQSAGPLLLPSAVQYKPGQDMPAVNDTALHDMPVQALARVGLKDRAES